MNPLRNRSTGKIEATLAYETLYLVAARAIATRPAKRPQDAVVHTAQSDLFLAKLAETAAAFLWRGPASAAKVAALTHRELGMRSAQPGYTLGLSAAARGSWRG
jgi:hypothetical protein